MLLAASGCGSPNAPSVGKLTITEARYFPRTPGNAVDSAVVLVKSEWHRGQFTLFLTGSHWVPQRFEIASDGEAVVPITLVRIGGPPLTMPDTITASAINFVPSVWVQR